MSLRRVIQAPHGVMSQLLHSVGPSNSAQRCSMPCVLHLLTMALQFNCGCLTLCQRSNQLDTSHILHPGTSKITEASAGTCKGLRGHTLASSDASTLHHVPVVRSANNVSSSNCLARVAASACSGSLIASAKSIVKVPNALRAVGS